MPQCLVIYPKSGRALDPCDWPKAQVSSPSMGAQGARLHPLLYALRFQSGLQKQTLRAKGQVPQYEPLPLVFDLNGRGRARVDCVPEPASDRTTL